MHGVIMEILVESGQSVAKGTTIAVMEAMKMQHELKTDINGTISEVSVKPGEQVAAGDLLIEIAADNE